LPDLDLISGPPETSPDLYPFQLNIKLNHTVLFLENSNIRGASKIKLKNVNKKRMATARRLIFLEFVKALLFSSLHNSGGGGDSDSGDSFADPCQFLSFPKTKILLSASLLHF
jgi:hypothetical protein